MTLRITFATALVFFCAMASAQDTDSPLSLSFAPSLQQLPLSDAETVPQPVLQTGEEELTVVEIGSPPKLSDTIDLTTDPDDLLERLRNGFSMPNINNDLVLYHQQWYLNRPDYLRRMVARSSRYLHHIVAELNKRGMPTELALLPMVESAYNPMAYSRSHASGLWQFIPSTGKQYKLEQNWWQDERRDVVASTTAALDYLQYIYEMHGDWHLALASYNWGEGAVGRAIEKNKAKGLPTDYLSLTMPAETRNYVPKLQALKNIFSNPAILADIGLRLVPNRPYFSTIVQGANIDVKLAARLAEIPVADFVALNPAHNRPVIKSDTPLVIPTDKVDTFMSNLESYQNSDKPLSTWQSYTLRRGDKLEKIAPRFGMTVANLKAVNGIKGRIKMTPGLTLLVAGNDSEESADISALPEQPRLPDADPSPSAASRTHVVRSGETLTGIAQRYGLTVAELKQLNHLQGNRLASGSKLAVSASSKTTVAKTTAAAASKQTGTARKSSRITYYTVRRGDTLTSIARHFKVDTDDLQRWNHLNAKTLQVGKKLTIQLAQKD